MKRKFTLLLFITLFTTAISAQINSAQNFTPKKILQLNSFNFGFGVNWNKFPSMSHNELMIFAKDPEQMQRDLSNMTEEATTMTAGGAFQVSFGFSPLSRKTGEYRADREIQFGVTMNTEKEAMVSFKNKDLDTSIVFCNLHEELSFEGAYIFRGNWGKRWDWYVGGGANAGFTFGNEMMLIEGKYFEPGQHPSTQPVDEVAPEMESYEAKSVYYTRVYIPFGVHYRLGKYWSIGFDMRKGWGAQVIGADKINFIRKTGSFALGARMLFD